MKAKILLVVFTAFALTPFSLTKAEPTAEQQTQIDTLKKTYPLTTCPVSGDKLDNNDMGEKPLDYLYTQTNADGTKTTRLVRFCCSDCLRKFKKNPAEYLKDIDDAQAQKTTAAVSPAPAAK